MASISKILNYYHLALHQFPSFVKKIDAKIVMIAAVVLSAFFALYSLLYTRYHNRGKYIKLVPLNSNIQTKLKKSTPYFPSREEAKTILSRNSLEDPLLGAFSPFDRRIRMKSDKPISQEDFLEFYLDQIQECTRPEQHRIEKDFKGICDALEQQGIRLPERISFIKSTMKEEIPGTHGYCRHNTIVFKSLSKHLLAHELFHIYSRSNPEMRKKLYGLVGYHLIPPLALPDQLKEKRITNPDLPYLDAYINVTYCGKVVPALPIDLFDLNYQGPGKSHLFEGIYHKFAMLEQKKNGEVHFQLDEKGLPILFDFDEAEDLKAQIGKESSYVDSAEEILADLFADMLMGRSSELIEKMKLRFRENQII